MGNKKLNPKNGTKGWKVLNGETEKGIFSIEHEKSVLFRIRIHAYNIHTHTRSLTYTNIFCVWVPRKRFHTQRHTVTYTFLFACLPARLWLLLFSFSLSLASLAHAMFTDSCTSACVCLCSCGHSRSKNFSCIASSRSEAGYIQPFSLSANPFQHYHAGSLAQFRRYSPLLCYVLFFHFIRLATEVFFFCISIRPNRTTIIRLGNHICYAAIV